jgi:hypothetical protein
MARHRRRAHPSGEEGTPPLPRLSTGIPRASTRSCGAARPRTSPVQEQPSRMSTYDRAHVRMQPTSGLGRTYARKPSRVSSCARGRSEGGELLATDPPEPTGASSASSLPSNPRVATAESPPSELRSASRDVAPTTAAAALPQQSRELGIPTAPNKGGPAHAHT